MKKTLVARFFTLLLPTWFSNSNVVAQDYWSPVIPLAQASNFADITMLEVEGHPAICYENYPPGYVMYVRSLDECGQTWGTPVNVSSFHTSPYGNHPSMTIVNGRPAISYYEPNNQELIFVRSNDVYGNSWSNFKVADTNGNVGEASELKVINGNPAISYVDLTNSCNQLIKYVRATDQNGDTWGTPVSLFGGLCACCQRTMLETVNGNPALMFGYPPKYTRANDANGNSWPLVDTIAPTGGALDFNLVDGFPVALLHLSGDSLGVMAANDVNGATWGTIDTLNLNKAVKTKASLQIVNDTVRVVYSNYVSNAILGHIQSPANLPLSFSEPDTIHAPVWYSIDNDLGGEYCGNTLAAFIDIGYLYYSFRDPTPCADKPVIHAPAVTQPTCAVPSGTIVVDASGNGTLEYSVGVSDFQASPVFSNLAPGSYRMYARFQSNPSCYSIYPGNLIVINPVPVPPVINALTITHPTCSVSSGKIIVNSSGNGYREFSKDGGVTYQSSNTFSSLPAGSYNIVVRLQAQPTCTTAYSGNPVIINAPPVPPTITAPTITHPSCVASTGTIVVNASGNGTLQYSINNGTNYFSSPTFTSLSPGSNYNIKVRLQAQPTCVTAYAGNPVAVNPVPSPPTISAPAVTQPTCAVPTGTILVNANGNGPLEYSIDNGASFQSSPSFASLAPGNYQVIVRLLNNPTCMTTYAGNPVVVNAVPVPPSVNGTDAMHPTCSISTGTIAVDASGGGSLQFSVDNGMNYQTGANFSNLSPGTYQVVVRLEANPSCTTAFAGNPVLINAVPFASVTGAPDLTQPTCAIPTGTMVVNATGSGALEFSADDGASYQPSETFAALPAGYYDIRVRLQADTACVAMYTGNPVALYAAPALPEIESVTTVQPVDCDSLAGSIMVEAGGSGVLEYSIENGSNWQTSNNFTNLPPGSYQLTVRLQADTTCSILFSGNPVNIIAPMECCLTPTYSNTCLSNDYVDDFTFGTFTNLNTGCANPGANNLSSYFGTGPSIQLGENYQVAIVAGQQAQFFGVYVDFNQNENYLDAGEFFDLGQAAANDTAIYSLTIPLSALQGTTTMRVRSSFAAPLTAADGCATNLGFGEIEDYHIYIFCPNNLAVDAMPIPDGTYNAEVEITSLGRVESGMGVIFQAGSSVMLLGGFEVQVGGLFEIILQGCFP